MNNQVEQVAAVIKAMSDSDLQYLVSLLSNDYKENEASTIGAMVYAYNTSSALIAQRDFTLREQASMEGK